MAETLKEALKQDLDKMGIIGVPEKYIYLKSLLNAAYYDNERQNSNSAEYGREKTKEKVYEELCKELGDDGRFIPISNLIDYVARKLSAELSKKEEKSIELNAVVNSALDQYYEKNVVPDVDSAANYVSGILKSYFLGDLYLYDESQRELYNYLASNSEKDVFNQMIQSAPKFHLATTEEYIKLYAKHIALEWCKNNEIKPDGYGNK